jgi:hypothetical protein
VEKNMERVEKTKMGKKRRLIKLKTNVVCCSPAAAAAAAAYRKRRRLRGGGGPQEQSWEAKKKSKNVDEFMSLCIILNRLLYFLYFTVLPYLCTCIYTYDRHGHSKGCSVTKI